MADPFGMRRRGQFYVCTICNAEFMLATTMLRHFEGELQDFRDFARDYNQAYHESRVRYMEEHGLPMTGGRRNSASS